MCFVDIPNSPHLAINFTDIYISQLFDLQKKNHLTKLNKDSSWTFKQHIQRHYLRLGELGLTFFTIF